MVIYSMFYYQMYVFFSEAFFLDTIIDCLRGKDIFVVSSLVIFLQAPQSMKKIFEAEKLLCGHFMSYFKTFQTRSSSIVSLM